MKSHGYFIHDYGREFHAQLGRVNKWQTTSHKSYFIKGLLNYRLIHTKYDKSISEKIPVVNAGYQLLIFKTFFYCLDIADYGLDMVSDAELINSHGNSLCYNYVTGCISLITFFFFDNVLNLNLNLLK